MPWPAHFNYVRKIHVMNSRGRKALSPHKAQELLTHPPADQPMTAKQVGYFRAIAHGWRPTRRSA